MPDIDKILKPIDRYIHAESTGGILLLLSAFIAIVWANSPWSDTYVHLWEYQLSITIGEWSVRNDLHHWINDGLMSMFFFVIGLELKREIMAGELSDIKKAMLPLIAAIGGMIFPALIYIIFNPDGVENNGWGIPMATDIAFALGIISLLGKQVPVSLKVFLTALAITDDLGAVLVIALFYTSEISLSSLGSGAVFLLILWGANYIGIRKTLFFGIIGIGGVWLAFLLSGVHATIAGVLAALAIPARAKIDEKKFVSILEKQMQEFHAIPPNDVALLEPAQYRVIENIHKLTDEAGTPLQKLEHQLHPWVAYLIMPLFALANAGIVLDASLFNSTFFQGISLGVLTGLVIGKFIGVVGLSWLMVKLKLASLPVGMGWRHLCGLGLLAGVGFTMSLFISTLAFPDPLFVTKAKIGIFIASIISGTAGFFVLRSALNYSNTFGTLK